MRPLAAASAERFSAALAAVFSVFRRFRTAVAWPTVCSTSFGFLCRFVLLAGTSLSALLTPERVRTVRAHAITSASFGSLPPNCCSLMFRIHVVQNRARSFCAARFQNTRSPSQRTYSRSIPSPSCL